jgi:hypothetical protein
MLLLLRSLLDAAAEPPVEPPQEPSQGGQVVGHWHFEPGKTLQQMRTERRRRDEEILFL